MGGSAASSFAVHESQHANGCTVCKHPDRKAIEREFLAFGKRYELERKWGLPKDSLYRHAKFFNLYEKRDETAGLHMIIEHGLAALENKAPLVTNTIEALKTLAKLNGRWVDQTMNVVEGFEHRSEEELEYFIDHGCFLAQEADQRAS